MPGTTEYKNTWMNLVHKEYWKNYAGDTGTKGEQVSDYITQIYNRISKGSNFNYLVAEGPFNGLVIETWHTGRDDCPQHLKTVGGCTYHAQELIQVNGYYDTQKTYSHELGHTYAFRSGLFNDLIPTKIGYDLWLTIDRMRGQDLDDRNKLGELFAEDFSFLFGSDGVYENEDAYWYGRELGAKRMPNEVPGLKFYIKGLCPVFLHLKDVDYSNFSYFDNSSYYQWFNKNKGCWEAFGGQGTFFKWLNGQWTQQ